MKFLILVSVIAFSAVVMADDAEDKQQLEEFGKIFKDETLSPADKQIKFNALIANLKGDFKSRFDQFTAESKQAVDSLTSPPAKAAAAKLNAFWEDGTMFQPKEKVQAAVEEVLKDLSPEDKQAIHDLGQRVGDKFKATFKDALPADLQ